MRRQELPGRLCWSPAFPGACGYKPAWGLVASVLAAHPSCCSKISIAWDYSSTGCVNEVSVALVAGGAWCCLGGRRCMV